MKSIVLAAYAFLTAAPLCAQAFQSRVVVDAVLGGGARSEYADGVWYRGNATPYGRLALTLQVPVQSRVAALLTLERAGNIETGDHLADCPPAPDGSCRLYFPPVAGYSLGLGARGLLLRRAELGVGSGVSLTGPHGHYFRADVGLQATRHLAAVAGLDYRVVRRSDNARLWWRPVFFGARFR